MTHKNVRLARSSSVYSQGAPVTRALDLRSNGKKLSSETDHDADGHTDNIVAGDSITRFYTLR